MSPAAISRDFPDDSRTDVNTRIFRAFLQDRSEVRTATIGGIAEMRVYDLGQVAVQREKDAQQLAADAQAKAVMRALADQASEDAKRNKAEADKYQKILTAAQSGFRDLVESKSAGYQANGAWDDAGALLARNGLHRFRMHSARVLEVSLATWPAHAREDHPAILPLEQRTPTRFANGKAAINRRHPVVFTGCGRSKPPRKHPIQQASPGSPAALTGCLLLFGRERQF